MSEEEFLIGVMAAIIYAGEHSEHHGVGVPLLITKSVERAQELLDEAANQAAQRTRAEREGSF